MIACYLYTCICSSNSSNSADLYCLYQGNRVDLQPTPRYIIVRPFCSAGRLTINTLHVFIGTSSIDPCIPCKVLNFLYESYHMINNVIMFYRYETSMLAKQFCVLTTTESRAKIWYQ